MPSPTSIPLRAADWTRKLPDAVASVSWSPASDEFVVAGVDGRLWIVGANGSDERGLPGHEGGTFRAAWHPRRPLVASAGQDGTVRFWDPRDGKPAGDFAAGAAWVEQLVWSPSGDWLAAGAGRILTLWHADRGVAGQFRDHRSTLSGLAWRPDGLRLAAACYGGVHLYDVAQSAPAGLLPWKTSVISVSWSPDDRWVVGGTQDNAVQIWEQPYRPGEELAMSGYESKVRELAWHRSGRTLATGGGTSIMVWDCSGKGPGGTTPRILEGHEGRVTVLAYQRTGHLLASGGEDGRVLFWNAGKSSQALRQVHVGAPVTDLAWSPDDQTVAVGCHDGTVALVRPPAM
ncbi:MAG: WD40 repeat domain-containing protein [Verrucomicrobia bacterium]|nr:MAG: WD40 repeat domain-containing protein [Verrucomicrobiota bacterium]